ncbi:MAG: lysozyme inhibitor LprI family protein [Verrucomicrobiaceae bacterium]
MRTTISFLAVLLYAVFATSGFAQEKKLTPQQAKALFEKADKALNEAWAAAKKVLDEAEFNKLKEDQRAWVEYRDYLARSPMYTGADVQELALDAPEYLEAAAGLEDMRTEWLKGLVREWKTDEPLTGLWTDSYGGHIEVVERDGHLYFNIECVRGPTSHIGDLAGIAAWNQTIGWFSDKGLDKEKKDETNLSFILRDRRLEVVGANTGYYHGARAYFDGEYIKVGTLDAKEQAKVVKAAKAGEVPEE